MVHPRATTSRDRPVRFEQSIGDQNIADLIRQQVLALAYTAHGLAPFARDLGYLHETGERQGQVRPPFVWDAEDRRARTALLDALFFHLYGIEPDHAVYFMDTFPIVREQDEAAFGGRYRTKEDVLERMRGPRGRIDHARA